MTDMDFGLGQITDAMVKQDALRTQRQQEQLLNQDRKNAAQNEIAENARRSAAVSQTLLEAMRPLAETLSDNEEGRQTQESLKSSGNPMGMFEFIGNQIVDPGKFTTKGRAKRMNEVQQETNVKVQVASTAQAAIQDLNTLVLADLAAGSGALNTALLLEQQGNERVQAEMARVQNQQGFLQSNLQLQDTVLATMSDEQLKAAYQKSGGKPIDVGGVMIAPGIIERRMEAVDQRSLIAESRALAIEGKKTQLAEKLAKQELETMNIEELRTLMLNGDTRMGVTAGGEYKLADVEAVYGIKNQARSDQTADAMKQFSYMDFGARVTVPAMEDANRMEAVVPAGSPLARSLSAYKNTVGTVMQLTNPYQTDNRPESDPSGMGPPQVRKQIPLPVMAASSAAIKSAQEELDKEVEKEASRKGRGNKNLTDIYREYYRGNAIPQASFEEFVVTGLEKNLPLTDVLPPDQAIQVKNTYNDEYQKLKQIAVSNPFGAPDDKTMKQQASQTALKKVVASSVGDKKTQQMYGGQLSVPGSPLAGIYPDANALMRDVTEADSAGMRAFQETKGLNAEEMAQVAQGNTVPGKVTNDDIVQLSVLQTQKFLLNLDRKEKGLSQKYIAWWSKNGQSYADTLVRVGQKEAQGGGVQQMGIESYAGPMARESANKYMQILEASAPGYEREKEARANRLVSFDANPEYTQAALLSWDKSLTDEDRRVVMKNVIRPAIELGTRRGLTLDEVNEFVNTTLQSAHFQDPLVQKTVKKVLSNRDQQIEVMQSVFETPWWANLGPFPTDPTTQLKRVYSSYHWYKDMDK